MLKEAKQMYSWEIFIQDEEQQYYLQDFWEHKKL